MKLLRVAAAAFVMVAASFVPANAQAVRDEIEKIVRDYLARNPEEVQRIVKDTLMRNPEVLQDTLLQLMKRRQEAGPPARPDKSAEIKSNAASLFSSARQVTLGNPNGDVTLVEFFDYNCGFCKRALADKLALLKSDPKLRLVLKELPILGPASLEAAKVAVAVRMNDAGGERYLAFHQKLLGERGQINQATALQAARDAGLDMAKVEKDLVSDEIDKSLQENASLARTLGINGTPSYVVGEQVIAGAIGHAVLAERIATERKKTN